MKKNWIQSLNGMGLGLIATLVVGTIMVQIGTVWDLDFLIQIGGVSKVLMSGGIGAGVAYALNGYPLVIFSAIVTGFIGGGAIELVNGQYVLSIGEPAGAYLAAVVTTLIGNRVYGKTKVDIILVPFLCLMGGGLVGELISPIMTQVTQLIGDFINQATTLTPLMMGAIISGIMCLVILSPISSAALAMSLGIEGLAAGAAVVGCASSMIGFAIISFKENGINGFIAQGVGTSKIQFANAIKNPYIVIPSLVASLLTGMVATTILKLECNSLGAGMGTSGLVGQIQTIAVMGDQALIKIVIGHFLLPAFISYFVYHMLAQRGVIKQGDMKLKIN